VIKQFSGKDSVKTQRKIGSLRKLSDTGFVAISKPRQRWPRYCSISRMNLRA
jgi:hypothetical protein